VIALALLTLDLPPGRSAFAEASPPAATPHGGDPDSGGCVEDASTLCLGEGDRFRLRVFWAPPGGQPAAARKISIGMRDSGLFYFFDPDNVEILVKVLDGCAINDYYWIIYAATTTVEFRLTVEDIESRQVLEYPNPAGMTAVPVTDVTGFDSCP
jgi:hypothetical protein